MRELKDILNINPNKMTVKELKEFIRYQTGKANLSISEYKQNDFTNTMYDSGISKLQEVSGVNKKTGAIALKFTGKNKAELVRQARELKYFNKWDIYSTEGKATLDEKSRKAYETFKENYGDNWSEQEWRDLVEAFGSVGNAMHEFGYGDKDRKAGATGGEALIQAVGDIKDKAKVNLLTAMQQSVRESKGLTNRERIKDITDRMQGLK